MSAPVLPRLRRRLSRMSRELSKRRRQFQDTPRLLVEHAAWLEPGDWVPVPANPGVWYHATAKLPQAVVAGGGKGATKLWPAANGAALSERVRSGVLTGAFRVQGLRQRGTARVPPVEPSQGNATAVVKANGNRADLVALEPEAGRALRLARPGTYDHEYVEARHRFQQYLPAPGFSVSDDGAVLVEDWADGQLLSGLAAERQVPVAAEVLDRYADLVATERAADEGTVWQALPRLLEQVRLPEVLREPLADARVQRLLASGLLTPSQGDLALVNVLADEHRSSWQVVDFDAAGCLPVWWDAVGLAAKFAGVVDDDARRALSEALDRVWAAAGLDDAAGMSDHHWAALAAVKGPWSRSTQASHLSGNGQFIEPDPDDFARRLHQQARKVKEQLARR